MTFIRAAACIFAVAAMLFAGYGLNTHAYGAAAFAALAVPICIMSYSRRWPLISRVRHDAESQFWARIVEEKEEQIRKLEAERRLLWDKICLLGIGAPVFAPLPDEEPRQQEEPKSKTTGSTMPTPMRPSAIMRRMDRLAEARWLRKINPSAIHSRPSATNLNSEVTQKP